MTPASVGHPCVGHRRHSLPCSARTLRAGCSDTGASRLVCRVLAPPEAPGRRPRSASVDSSQPTPTPPSADFWSSTTSFASQLLSHFRVPAFAAASPDAVLREASSKERELQNAKAPLDVSAFLAPVGVWELKHIRRLSSLTALTYYMHLVTPRRLQRLHGLELVATSRACDIRSYEHSRTAEEVGADGDGMAVSVHEAREVYQALKRNGGGGAAEAAPSSGLGLAARGLSGSSNIVTLPRELPYQVVTSADAPPGGGSGGGPSWPTPPGLLGGQASSAAPMGTAQQPAAAPAAAGTSAAAAAQQPQQGPQQAGSSPAAALPRMLRTPAEVVAAKLAEAASAASTAAATSPLASAAESLYAGLAALPLVGSYGNRGAANAALPAPAGSAPAADAAAVAADAASYAGPGGRKATAASIAALASDRLRQQTVRGATLRAGRAGGGGGGGMAVVSASGMMASAAPAAGAASAAAGLAASAPSAPAAAANAAIATASTSTSASLTFASGASMGCPSEWFVVDEETTHTRVFVIQGSDTLDHWKLNLTFDPVTFEEPSLGVKVHRGVYEAANVLYDRFLPLVYEHLESSPFSKIAFTGHSIGGSLATLLMLMYRCRGVLPPHSIATVYTFGAPAVFCQAHSQSSVAGSGSGSSVPCPPSSSTSWVSPTLWSLGSIGGSASSVSSYEDAPPAASPSSPSPSHAPGSSPGCACGADLLLARLQLPPAIVRNIIMTRDIVPRAFACDYSPVADILKGWGPSFKEHCCLNRQGRKHLYYFVGRMCILQPDSAHTFTANDPDHPMMPPGPDLLAVVESPIRGGAAPPPPPNSPPPPVAAAATEAAPAAAPARPAARNVTEAIWELMDCPHPLETLADPGAYLASGSISRYHNPEHYTKALGRVTFLKRQEERRLMDQRPPPPPPPPTPPQADSDSDSVDDDAARGGAAATAAVKAVKATATAAAAVPWDSSDGLDLDLHLAAPTQLASDAHACR